MQYSNVNVVVDGLVTIIQRLGGTEIIARYCVQIVIYVIIQWININKFY